MNKDIKRLTASLNERLGRPATAYTDINGKLRANVGHIFTDLATCYGGYRINEMHNEQGGQCGFAGNSGTEPRRSCKEMIAYLKGIHDALDAIEMQRSKAA